MSKKECSESESEQQTRKLREGGDTAATRETANYDPLTVPRAGGPDVQESREEDVIFLIDGPLKNGVGVLPHLNHQFFIKLEPGFEPSDAFLISASEPYSTL